MISPNERVLKRPATLVKRLFRLERCGRYREALDELSDVWPNLEHSPDLSDFSPDEALEMRLRCGALIGFYAPGSQQYSQEISLEILGSVRREFEAAKCWEKFAESCNYIALAFQRKGDMREAQIFIDESLSVELPVSSQVRLHSYIIQCLIGEPSDEKNKRNLATLKSVEAAFLRFGDDCLKGDYFNHCGMALDNLDRKSEALDHYEFAKYHHERSRHRQYLATVENNLAWAYMIAGDFPRAYSSINNAARLLRIVKDKTREGFSLDTKAAIFMAEKRYPEAYKTIEKAIKILEISEAAQFHSEALLTKSKILLGLDRFHDAFLTLSEAMEIARVKTGDESVRRFTSEFENACINLRREREKPAETGENSCSTYEFVLPGSLGGYADYRAVRIHNSRLESIGIDKGSLAVIGECPVEPGDLVAVTERESGEVVCGYYHSFFEIVGLEGCDGELVTYDEKAVSILGKIIGVCPRGLTTDGRIEVDALKI